mmetsp:Transcript_7703/g.13977  ORF Transcript_7703/g.13977 Transcript_7703/m.13977 type:complete len:87 (-) Transcript_7703:165-425(-)
MEFLVQATDSNQLKLFARIFFEQLEETDKSLELFRRVLTMEESSFGKGHVITGSTYQYLGRVLLSKGDRLTIISWSFLYKLPTRIN